MLLSSNSDGTRLSSGGSTKAVSIKAIFKQMFAKSNDDDILLEAVTKCCSNIQGLPKDKHIQTILKLMHSNTSSEDGATPDRITLLTSTLKWMSNNIITNKILTTLLILQHHGPPRYLCRYNEAQHFLQSMIDSDEQKINPLNRQYALLLLQKIIFHNSNGTVLSKFFTTKPVTVKSLIIDTDYSVSISSNEILLIISMLLTIQNEIIKLINIIFSIKDSNNSEIITYHLSLQPIIQESFCVVVALSNLIKKLFTQEVKNNSITVSYINQYNDQLESLRLLYRRANDIQVLKENEAIPQTLPEFFPLA